MTNSVVLISGTQATVPSGDELLRGPTKRELHAAIERLFLGFPDANRTDVAKVAALYTEIISEFSAWSIKEGVHRITSGKIPGINMAFLPSTAIVAHTIRTIAENGPEAKERLWRNLLASWRAGREWGTFHGPSPDEPSFEFHCPKHLLADFNDSTAHRRHFARM